MHYEDFFDPPEGEEGYSRKLDRDIIDDDDDADDGEEGDDDSNEEGGDAEMEKSQEDKIKDELGVM